MTSTQDFLLRVLRDKLHVTVEEWSFDISLSHSGLSLESMAIVELTMHCEEELGIEIPEADVAAISQMTIQELANYLDRRVGVGRDRAAPLTLDSLARLLAATPVLEPISRSGPDEQFVLDSLGVTWLAHFLEELHGVAIDIADPQLSEPTSLRRLLTYLQQATRPERSPSE